MLYRTSQHSRFALFSAQMVVRSPNNAGQAGLEPMHVAKF